MRATGENVGTVVACGSRFHSRTGTRPSTGRTRPLEAGAWTSIPSRDGTGSTKKGPGRSRRGSGRSNHTSPSCMLSMRMGSLEYNSDSGALLTAREGASVEEGVGDSSGRGGTGRVTAAATMCGVSRGAVFFLKDPHPCLGGVFVDSALRVRLPFQSYSKYPVESRRRFTLALCLAMKSLPRTSSGAPSTSRKVWRWGMPDKVKSIDTLPRSKRAEPSRFTNVTSITRWDSRVV